MVIYEWKKGDKLEIISGCGKYLPEKGIVVAREDICTNDASYKIHVTLENGEVSGCRYVARFRKVSSELSDKLVKNG